MIRYLEPRIHFLIHSPAKLFHHTNYNSHKISTLCLLDSAYLASHETTLSRRNKYQLVYADTSPIHCISEDSGNH